MSECILHCLLFPVPCILRQDFVVCSGGVLSLYLPSFIFYCICTTFFWTHFMSTILATYKWKSKIKTCVPVHSAVSIRPMHINYNKNISLFSSGIQNGSEPLQHFNKRFNLSRANYAHTFRDSLTANVS